MLRTTTAYAPLTQGDADALDNDVPAPVDVGAAQAWSSTSPRRSSRDRPPVYYGEGPFEAPSSEDEDEEKDLVSYKRKESAGMRVLQGLGYRDEADADELEGPIPSGLVVGKKVRYLGYGPPRLCLT